MTLVLGGGSFRYEAVENWAQLPPELALGDVGGVAVDKQDRVYVFNRGRAPVVVFDRDGRYLKHWGEGIFTRAHGVDIGPDEALYLTDDQDHSVRKCSLDGKVLLTLGIPRRTPGFMSGQPFCGCTHTALAPNGDIYVSDGYGNARVHKYSPDGTLLFSWGEPGTDPGQFNIVHNICTDRDGWVYVADRENHRVQVFDSNGRFETQWHNMHRPCGLYMDRSANPLCYVGELGPDMPVNINVPNCGPRVSVYNAKGELLARLGDLRMGEGPGQFIAPHGLAVDSRGDIYVGEVSNTVYSTRGWPINPMRRIRSLQKLAKVNN
jgi:DNA-binding beta-propeller fold protein YncE